MSTKYTSVCMSMLSLFMVSGCTGPDHAAAIRSRFQQVAANLTKGDIDACLPLVDPLFIRGQGTDAVKLRLGIVTTLIRLGQVQESDIRLDDVLLSEDKKTAQTPFSMHDGKNDSWNVQPALKWVLHEGQWYVSF